MNEEILHYTDLSFFHYCHNTFHVNRGVLNTIDEWFYKKGEFNILERRKHIIYFLSFITKNKGSQVRFGPGGLSSKLKKYWEQLYCLDIV